ncbi:MAG: hypothetical protein CVV02_10720 [Firmicutes bacterium HGW-Firmicutes-7]|nr:MAG: hypothetical protein CVV02_10720 [Firmicutes bacterium HGW-Firmicutes-7]
MVKLVVNKYHVSIWVDSQIIEISINNIGWCIIMSKIYFVLQQIIIFIAFGSIYYLIEILYDGTSHWAMFVCAGLTGNVADYLHKFHARMNYIKKAFFITSVILVLEYVSGYILNIYYQLNIWDYSNMGFNLHGQVCLTFAFIWFFIFSPLIIWFVAGIRYVIFGERRPLHVWHIYSLFFTEVLGLIGLKVLEPKNLTF